MTFPLSTPSMQKTLLATVQSRLVWKQGSSKKGWMRSSLNTSQSLIQLIQRHRLHQWLIQKIKKLRLATMDLFQARPNSITTRKNWQPSSTGMNTYTNSEWGNGKEDPRYFNPTNLDTDQWIRTLKETGSNGPLWLLNTTTVSLLIHLSHQPYRSYSPWKDGRVTFSKKFPSLLASTTWTWVFTYPHGMPTILNTMSQPKKRIQPILSQPAERNPCNPKYGNKGKFIEVWMDGARGSGAQKK